MTSTRNGLLALADIAPCVTLTRSFAPANTTQGALMTTTITATTATTTPAPEHHPLLVVGAGLGGLTLARVLALHGVRCTVLDLDPARDARP